MGIPGYPLYGNVDLGSAVEDVEKAVAKIKSNKFGKKDIVALHKATTELLNAVLSNEYED